MGDDGRTMMDETFRVVRSVIEALHNLQRTMQELAPPWFDAPLVGVANGGDPLFTDFKRDVGPDHWTPLEAFSATPTAPLPRNYCGTISGRRVW